MVEYSPMKTVTSVLLVALGKREGISSYSSDIYRSWAGFYLLPIVPVVEVFDKVFRLPVEMVIPHGSFR